MHHHVETPICEMAEICHIPFHRVDGQSLAFGNKAVTRKLLGRVVQNGDQRASGCDGLSKKTWTAPFLFAGAFFSQA